MIVNARMYAVAPAAKAAWRGLLGWIVESAGLRMQIVDHDPPATLHDLWQLAAVIREESVRYADLFKRANIRAE